MEIRLSIIIPFYNVEEYISECLDSLYQQDIAESDYEIICVNDCSLDNSKNIVLNVKNTHSNLVLIEHSFNKMLGEARNTGLKEAKGKYVWFIDSDDFIEKNTIGKILDFAEKNRLDTIEFNAMHYYNDRSEVHSLRQNTSVISGLDFIFDKEEKYEYKSNSAWCKFYLRNFLIDNNLFFEQRVSSEDIFHTFRARLLSDRYQFVNIIVYHHRFNPNSLSQNLNAKKTIDFINAIIQVIALISTEKTLIINKGYSTDKLEKYYFKLINNYRLFTNLSSEEKKIIFSKFSNIKLELIYKLQLNKKLSFIYINPKLSYLMISVISPLINIIRILKKYLYSKWIR